MSAARVVSLDYINEQRAAGWPDMHPEDYCHRCGDKNISWWIDPAVWNPIMRPNGPDAPWLWNEIICPQCFTEMFEKRYPDAIWQLSLSPSRGARQFHADIEATR